MGEPKVNVCSEVVRVGVAEKLKLGLLLRVLLVRDAVGVRVAVPGRLTVQVGEREVVAVAVVV